MYFYHNLQVCSFDEQAHAYKYLANYHLKANQLEKAYYAAQKCTEFFEVLLPIFKQIFTSYFYCEFFLDFKANCLYDLCHNRKCMGFMLTLDMLWSTVIIP